MPEVEEPLRWDCPVCSYAYDARLGDPFQGFSPRPFSQLPADWRCPWCGVPKKRFTPEV